MMSATQVKAAPAPRRLGKVLVRLLCLLAVATCVGWTLHRSAAVLRQGNHTAGFGEGIVHGALMPLALPNLFLGDDVMIYAPNNTGRSYKLGYTAGVNGCGLIFFGLFFWRVSRWRRQSQSERERTAAAG
jgi:hypothetical protein